MGLFECLQRLGGFSSARMTLAFCFPSNFAVVAPDCCWRCCCCFRCRFSLLSRLMWAATHSLTTNTTRNKYDFIPHNGGVLSTHSSALTLFISIAVQMRFVGSVVGNWGSATWPNFKVAESGSRHRFKRS